MKIVVVEDEIRTRRGVVGLIQKLSPEYEVIGEAENGLLGYELITELSPDLAIVDVKMPKMDGIEMIQNLRKAGINCRAVILSGYSEFEYAQKAIKMGVSEYLLKPITVEDLENTLKNVKKEIEAERLEKKQNSLTSIEQIFQNLVLGDIGKEDKYIEYLNEKYELSPDSEYIAVVGYLGNGYKSGKDAVKGIVTPLIEKLTDLKYYIIDLNPQNELLILMVSPENPRELEKYFQDQILKAICNSGIRDMVLGWIQFDGLKNLKSSLQILKKELKWSIVLGEDILLTYPKTQKIFTRLLQYPIDIEKNVRAAVYSNDMEKLIKNVEDFLELMHREIYKPDQIIEVFVRFASSIINVIKEVNAELYDQLNQKEILQRIIDSFTWHEIKGALMELTEKLSAYDKSDNRIYSLIVKRTLNIIHDNYSNGITLEEVAMKLNITVEYLSSLFLKETGRNFTSYIKTCRINKAKELLVNTDLKSYEIGNKVGYSDPKYFTRVFKEVTGLSPGEYQKAYKV